MYWTLDGLIYEFGWDGIWDHKFNSLQQVSTSSTHSNKLMQVQLDLLSSLVQLQNPNKLGEVEQLNLYQQPNPT